MRSYALLLVPIAAIACGDSGNPKPKASAEQIASGAARADGFVGVDPSVFECDTITPKAGLAGAVGGTVEAMDSMFTPPRGTPKPCDYYMIDPPAADMRDGAPAPAQMMWSIRYDCRESYIPGTIAEMERLVAEDGAVRVDVGKGGIDARNSALQFADDDAPCTVNVVGPGAAQRAAIARLVASNLTPATAPMTPRAAP